MAQVAAASARRASGRDRVLRHNGQMPAGRPRLELITPSASAEEAAAIVAALERFMRATAPPPAPAAEGPDPWQRVAMLEGVERESQADLFDAWINT
jgi:hypothetical protein